jgi:hypothetical protein
MELPDGVWCLFTYFYTLNYIFLWVDDRARFVNAANIDQPNNDGAEREIDNTGIELTSPLDRRQSKTGRVLQSCQ